VDTEDDDRYATGGSLVTMRPIMVIKHGDKYEINTWASVTPARNGVPTALLTARDALTHTSPCMNRTPVYARNNQPIISVSVCAQVLRLPLLIAAIVKGSSIPPLARLMSYILNRSRISPVEMDSTGAERERERGGETRVIVRAGSIESLGIVDREHATRLPRD